MTARGQLTALLTAERRGPPSPRRRLGPGNTTASMDANWQHAYEFHLSRCDRVVSHVLARLVYDALLRGEPVPL